MLMICKTFEVAEGAVVKIFSIGCSLNCVSPKGTDFAKQMHLQYTTNSTDPIEHNVGRMSWSMALIKYFGKQSQFDLKWSQY